jgi:hypothetical protein
VEVPAPPAPPPEAVVEEAPPAPVVYKRGRTLLNVSTEPAGAVLTMDGGRALGRSPHVLDLKTNKPTRISARLAGHKLWTKFIRPHGREMQLDIKLQPLPRARKRR